MVKLRKQRKRKRFMHNVNRKRLRNKLEKIQKVTCKQMKDVWEKKKSAAQNFADMGLAYDVNKLFKVNNFKDQLKSKITSTTAWKTEDLTEPEKPSKAHVIEEIEKEAKAPRQRMFKLPKSQVEYITYLMDKYGTDFKAMARDKRNYYQETWKQIRAKVKTFMGIPEQYGEYLEKRGLLDESEFEKSNLSTFNLDSDSD